MKKVAVILSGCGVFDGAEIHESDIEPQTLVACMQFAKAQKVVGYLCISPALMSFVYGDGIKLTIGKDQATALSLEAMGAEHVNAEVQQVVVDESHKAVSSPAYMLAQSISEVADSVEALVKQTLSMS